MNRLLTITALLIAATAAYAACPAGVPSGVTTCYYIAANGSDSNDGASEAAGHPWLHAPGMPSATGNSAAHTPAAGEGFIFRGGDTWHLGASTSPAVGGTWTWAWSGSNGSPIYIGVDSAWYSGGSWARPVMNGDNPLSTSPVGSCSYQTGSANNMFVNTSNNYVTLDNFEFMGMCQNDVNAPFAHDVVITESNGANNVYEHLYIHGWTALAFSCSLGVGNCFNMETFLGSNLDGDVHLQNVLDGTDSVPGEMAAMFGGGYDVSQSVFTNVAQIVITRLHKWHDNLMTHWYEPGDGDAHGNLLESSGESPNSNLIYNNVFQDICSDSGACSLGIVGIWPQPDVGKTDYIFNNVISNGKAMGGNYIDVGQNSGPQGAITAFNNTFDQQDASPIFNCSPSYPPTLTSANNHLIVDGGAFNGTCTGHYTTTTDITMTHATAATDGYTNAQTNALSPTSSGSPTVGGGTSNSSFCSAISSIDSGAGTACANSTGYACTYNSTAHTVSCPALALISRGSTPDRGAYQYSGTPTAAAPTFSPTSPYTGSATTVTASTSTSGCGPYIYFGNTNPPTTNTTTYSFTANITLYAYVHGCPTYADSSISTWSGSLTGAPPSITSTSPLPTGTVGVVYNGSGYQMTATGGTPPYTWTDPACSGACNTGLIFNSSGLWYGTPAHPGTSTFTVQVTDSLSSSSSGPFQITINPAVSAPISLQGVVVSGVVLQ